MLKKRLIPVLLLKNGQLVRSERFATHQIVGNPIHEVQRFNEWSVDELVYVDISEDDEIDGRLDMKVRRQESVLDILDAVAAHCFMPLTFGGRIRTLEDVRARIAKGADKITLSTSAIETPELVTEAAKAFGSQAIVVVIDAKRTAPGVWDVVYDHARKSAGRSPAEWAREVEALGAGEILLQSVDRDGTAEGYDVDLLRSVTGITRIPVVALGGVGRLEHFSDAILKGGASAAAAANIFHFVELSDRRAKRAMAKAGVDVRILSPRGPMRYCTRCVYPGVAATPLTFDENGVCSGCRVSDQRKKIDYAERRKMLAELLAEYKTDGSNYDCIIPVSGGKDSYYQAHVIIKEFGLKPLLVTYHGNNYLPVGERNLHRMREVFDCDHIIFRPSVQTLVKLNRACFYKMGDMNWHAHCGIFTYPVQAAYHFRVPLLIWGEHGYTDLSGMYSMNDFVEMTAKYRLEHAQRGYDWKDMVGVEGLGEKDLLWAKYPTDDQIDEVGIRGIYIFNYVPWEANDHAKLVEDLYGWEPSPEPFDRTYRRMSNLDDMHENGVHDYLKYVKFGYGRGTDHACKDIRAGKLTREQGIEMVRKYDHVKPRDLDRWLRYVGMTEAEFDRVCDTFRDPRVWRKNASGAWEKDNIWDSPKP